MNLIFFAQASVITIELEGLRRREVTSLTTLKSESRWGSYHQGGTFAESMAQGLQIVNLRFVIIYA